MQLGESIPLLRGTLGLKGFTWAKKGRFRVPWLLLIIPTASAISACRYVVSQKANNHNSFAKSLMRYK